MKKINITYCLLLGLLLFSYRAEAQSGSLGVSSIANFPDTIYEGVSYDSILVYVINQDSVPFQGVIELWMMADSSNFPVLLSQGAPVFQINPGDSTSLVINNYFFDPSAFKAGDNIVVVWPIANVSQVDSFYTQKYYVHTVGVNDYYSQDELAILPNPAQERITLKLPSNGSLERVRIYSYNGRLVEELDLKSLTIPVIHLSNGVYFFYFYHRYGVSVRKFIKQ